jgi:hypothetical protein
MPNSQMTAEDYRLDIVLVFYKVGLVGLKIDQTSTISWVDGRGISVSKSELSENQGLRFTRRFGGALAYPKK